MSVGKLEEFQETKFSPVRLDFFFENHLNK